MHKILWNTTQKIGMGLLPCCILSLSIIPMTTRYQAKYIPPSTQKPPNSPTGSTSMSWNISKTAKKKRASVFLQFSAFFLTQSCEQTIKNWQTRRNIILVKL